MSYKPTITAETPFFERARLTLDVSAEKLAEIVGLDLQDVYRLCADGNTIVGDADASTETYENLFSHLSEHLGQCLALRHVLSNKIHQATQARIKQRKRILGA